MTPTLFLTDSVHHTQVWLSKPPVESGLLVVCARNGRRVCSLHSDILEGFGVRPDVRSGQQRLGATTELDLIEAWATAHRLSGFLLAHAEWCDPRWYADLHDRLQRAGTQLGLIADDDCADELADWVDQRGGTVASGTELDQFVAIHTRDAIPLAEDTGEDYPQILPLVDFYLWRSRCRQTLNGPDFAKVNAQYCDTYRKVVANPPQSPEQAAETLLGLVDGTTHLGRATTMLRAMQAAVFTRGWSLQLLMPAFRSAIAEQQHRRFAPAELRAMRAYAQPWMAAAAILKDADVDYRTIPQFTLGCVDAAGDLTDRRGERRPLTPEAALYLRAQRRLRELEGAQPGDLLLNREPRDIQTAQRTLLRDLNLHMVAHTRMANEGDWVSHLRIIYRPLNGTPE